jgi:hypothetical protein
MVAIASLGRLCTLPDQLAGLLGQLLQRLVDLPGGPARLARQLLDLLGDDGEALAGLARARRLDRRVEGQQVGLLGDRVDPLGDLADLGQRVLQAVQLLLDHRDRLDQVVNVAQRAFDRAAGVLDLAGGVGGGVATGPRAASDSPVGLRHLVDAVAQIVQLLRLRGQRPAQIVDAAGDVGDLDPEPAALLGQLAQNLSIVRRVAPCLFTHGPVPFNALIAARLPVRSRFGQRT